MKDPSLTQLNKLVVKWQKILRLQDWDIDASYSHDMPEGACACVLPALNCKHAALQVMPRSSYESKKYDDIQPYDVENAVVHELMHLHLTGLGKLSTHQTLIVEQCIESVGPALVFMDKFVQMFKDKQKKGKR